MEWWSNGVGKANAQQPALSEVEWAEHPINPNRRKLRERRGKRRTPNIERRIKSEPPASPGMNYADSETLREHGSFRPPRFRLGERYSSERRAGSGCRG